MLLGGVTHRLARHERLCRQCYRETEDETHFLLRCPLYARHREALILQLELSSKSPMDRVHTFVMRREHALQTASTFDCYRTMAWLMEDEDRMRSVLIYVRNAFGARRRLVSLTQT